MKANVEWVHCVISVRRSGMRATSDERANEFCGYYGVYSDQLCWRTGLGPFHLLRRQFLRRGM